jgi:hypothetical protein
MTKVLDQDDVVTLLKDWEGSNIEVIVRGRDSDAWLCRFGGTLGKDEGAGAGPFAIDVGGPEAWVIAVPLSFDSAVLAKADVLVVHHADGETTIRKAR